ncbi:Formylmethanofuran--tetrahydromethanopterin N-formyltransferase [Halanaerobium saccharolyticum subsp. saccharolyticum DSM 6643]|uniref:Formylmethanofuran--tetrahydromethanopterin formyltransferase n=1 Tax=Halanaerobium saccharolyticum subsp. saccharolyticum DSM 6643 TaxID=1293054 RepID=M5DYM8_9FIRM|nr:formylmethanofuran--tetrahydromethanopterin N-formyltransferase [Halanaerobium saccharolyticum]CCU78276.1 Formylmethanofuran--tetrahydromethanopterin N-formyltransferase [Halanaerobium saccharolyticum subsp. saccharolyticum DSM 6643]
MHYQGIEIEDTFAEAFTMYGTRVIVTAATEKWAEIAAREAVGFATSIIECGIEAGIEKKLSSDQTLDGRPGVSLLFFTMKEKSLLKEMRKRIGQTIMTAATTACFNGLDSDKKIKVGGNIRYFGDGFQISKLYDDRRFWRIPIMGGEFLIEESFGIQKGIGGGNIIIAGSNSETALNAAEKAVAAMRKIEGVVMPFPGGIVSSGSKVTSKYSFLNAATNTKYCPTIKAQTETNLAEEVGSVLEIVIDGLSVEATAEAMKVGIKAAAVDGVIKITAGNYGGDLGSENFYLKEILRGDLDD